MIEILIAALPLLLLLGSLLLGFYPGCEAALRLAERLAASARRRLARAVAQRPPRPPASHAARGGLLLALGLSGRAPLPSRPTESRTLAPMSLAWSARNFD